MPKPLHSAARLQSHPSKSRHHLHLAPTERSFPNLPLLHSHFRNVKLHWRVSVTLLPEPQTRSLVFPNHALSRPKPHSRVANLACLHSPVAPLPRNQAFNYKTTSGLGRSPRPAAAPLPGASETPLAPQSARSTRASSGSGAACATGSSR